MQGKNKKLRKLCVHRQRCEMSSYGMLNIVNGYTK